MAWGAAAVLAVVGSPTLAFGQGGGGQGGGGGGGNQGGGTIGTAANQTIPTINSFSSGGNTSTNTQGSTTTNSTSTNQSSSSSNQLNIPGATSNVAGNAQAQNFQLAAIKQAPSLTNTNNTAINTSNFLRNTYGAVYYQGANPSTVPNQIPGGFGQVLYTATGATGNRGGTAIGGNRGGNSTITDPGGQIVTLPKQIAYTSQVQFKMPGGNLMPQLQGDLRSAIDRVPTDQLTNPAGVQVAVDGRNVTLKGSVKDTDESRLVEGLVRLTPGVFVIKNELVVAK
jgi:hypothetical protein